MGGLARLGSGREPPARAAPVRAARRDQPGRRGRTRDFTRFVPVLCGPGIGERLAPAATLAEVSPAALTPSAGSVVMVSGVLHRLVPPWVAYDYARALRGRVATAPRLVDVPDAGHFDLVTPCTPAWGEVIALVEQALEP